MIKIILSEWGKHSPPFNDVKAAIKHCKKNNLLDGKEGILWIKGEYMHMMYEARNKKWEWCSVFKKWDSYPELQTAKYGI